MIEFLTTSRAVYRVEEIISEAQKHIVLISPYLQIGQTFRDRLSESARRGVPITVVMRDIPPDERDWLLSVPGLLLLTLSNLHAKCYLNERLLVITSLNLYEHSQKNREMGVVVSADEEMYVRAWTEVDSILKAATLVSGPAQSSRSTGAAAKLAPAPRPASAPTPAPTQKPAPTRKPAGFCIRCAGNVALNPAAPLCRECWTVWVVFENEEYPEKFCHECGRKADTSKARPRCERCFRKSAAALR